MKIEASKPTQLHRVKYTINVGTGEASAIVCVDSLDEANILKAIFDDLYDASYEILEELK